MLQVTGTLEKTDFLDEFQGVEGVLYARPLVEAGAACVSVADGLPTWCAPLPALGFRLSAVGSGPCPRVPRELGVK